MTVLCLSFYYKKIKSYIETVLIYLTSNIAFLKVKPLVKYSCIFVKNLFKYYFQSYTISHL